LYTAFFDKVSQHVHFTPVFFRGVIDDRRGIKPLLTPSLGPFQKPVEDTRTLPQQFFFKVFILSPALSSW
jgi:hypothetical protein